jgi:hypothetical protein
MNVSLAKDPPPRPVSATPPTPEVTPPVAPAAASAASSTTLGGITLPLPRRTLAVLAAAAVAVLIVGVVIANAIGSANDVQAGGGTDELIDDGSGTGTGTDGSGSGETTLFSPADIAQLPAAAGVDPSFYEVGDGVYFITPSGNIRCGITPDDWGCDIAEKEWSGPSGIGAQSGGDPAPRSGSDYPAGLQTLQYTTSVTFGHVTCVSVEPHTVCADLNTGHGFVISRNENEVF